MAIQKINLGTEPHGVGGDSYREANEKINSNFDEVVRDINIVSDGNLETLDKLSEEVLRAKAAESDLNADIIKEVSDRESEVTRLDEADAVLQAQINSVGGGKLAYKTYAEMIADESNISAKSSIDIIADTDDKNGTYLYDGTDFVKSQYDLENIIRTKVQNTFGTYTQMVASNLSDGAYALVADDTNDKNGIYIKEGGVWIKSKYYPNGFKVLVNDNLNDVIDDGVYILTYTQFSTIENNYPREFLRTGATIIVNNFEGIVRQSIITRFGVAHRFTYEGVFSDWSGVAFNDGFIVGAGYVVYDTTRDGEITDLNTVNESKSLYFTGSSQVKQIANRPFDGLGACFDCTISPTGAIQQRWLTTEGVAHRWGNYYKDTGEFTWRDWQGIKFKEGVVTDLSKMLAEYHDLDRAEWRRLYVSPDNVRESGTYYLDAHYVATKEHYFPIFSGTGSRTGGILTVHKSNNGMIHQHFVSSFGNVFRYGLTQADESVEWQPWAGIKLTTNSMIEFDINGNTKGAKPLVLIGSSSLSYMSQQLIGAASKRNMPSVSYAKDGHTLDNAGLAQGSNRVALKFPSGVIQASGGTSVKVVSEFDSYLRGVPAESILSNGVKGSVNANLNTYTASNLTSDLSVDPDMEYEVYLPDWEGLTSNGVYVFNMGKNNISNDVDNAQEVFELTVKMVDAIPKTANFIVGGHFSNRGWSAQHKANVEEVNRLLKLKYGLRYFDYNEHLFGDDLWQKIGKTKTATDLQNIADRELPISLSRESDQDTGHLSTAAYKYMAYVIEDKLADLGYISDTDRTGRWQS